MVGPERRNGETIKAYEAFMVYCGMGIKRSVEGVARRCGKSVGLCNRWARRWAWLERATAHDDQMFEAERLSAIAIARAKGVDWAARAEELKAGEWRARQRLIDLAERIADRWMASGEFKMGTLEGLARLLEVASVLGRRACGEVLDRKEITGADGGPIRIEFEAALKRLYGDQPPGAAVTVAPPPSPPVVDVEAVPVVEGQP